MKFQVSSNFIYLFIFFNRNGNTAGAGLRFASSNRMGLADILGHSKRPDILQAQGPQDITRKNNNTLNI